MSEVYKAIAAVQGELAKVGISKDGVNESQKYKFRGIDQVYGALAPLLAKHGLCVIPRMVERDMHERVTVKEWQGQKKESVLFYVTVKAEFDFVAVSDGSKHMACTYGEAMDSGDKATNKAMSAAYKYAAFMTFAIPTEGDNDADSTTHEVAGRVANDHEPETRKPPVKLAGPYTSKTALWGAVRAFDREVRSCGDLDEILALLATTDTIALMGQIERDAPQLAHGGDSLPAEFEPLHALIARMRTDLEAASDDSWKTDVTRAG